MKFYCFWECTKLGAVFMVDSIKIVDKCPFCDEPPEAGYPDHFEDGHTRRIFSEQLLFKYVEVE